MPCQHCCFLQARRRCFSSQGRACQSTLLWMERVASVLKAVFALAVNHTITVGRHRLITLRTHLHEQHWNPGGRPGFYKIPLPASLLSLCTQPCGSHIPAHGPFRRLAGTKAVCRQLVGASLLSATAKCASVPKKRCRPGCPSVPNHMGSSRLW